MVAEAAGHTMTASRQASGSRKGSSSSQQAKKTKTSATPVKLPPIQQSKEEPTPSKSRKASVNEETKPVAQSMPVTEDE